MEEELTPMPDILGMSLYESVDLKSLDFIQIAQFLTFHENILNEHSISSVDCFCVKCGRDTTFKSRNTDDDTVRFVRKELMDCYESTTSSTHHEFNYSSFISALQKIEFFKRIFYCPRASNDHSHDIVIILRVNSGKIIKIGQFPQLADLQNTHLKKYKELHSEIYQELNRAAGLNSHGIGVGSFVYLRRIIEKYIVSPEIDKLLKDEILTAEQVNSADFRGKVTLAKEHLPSVLVDNPRIYSILSKGIHTLSEKECLEIFNPLLTAIELILDDRLEKLEREIKTKKLQEDLNRISK